VTPTAGQAAYEAAVAWDAEVDPPLLTEPWDALNPHERECWNRVAQAAADAATEGSLRACGYTLADIARFLEAEVAAQEPHAAPGSDAGAKLAAIRAHCERKAAEFSADMFAVRPQDIRVNAGDILAIIDGVAL
jgi:hypothetical protein